MSISFYCFGYLCHDCHSNIGDQIKEILQSVSHGKYIIKLEFEEGFMVIQVLQRVYSRRLQQKQIENLQITEI
jgi:hypothetical protein